MTKRFFFSKVLFPTAVAVTVSYLLLSRIPVQSVPQTLARLPIHALVIGFGSYCLLVWTKALRFRELLMIDLPARRLLPILALHTFWGNFLPMRSGDLSYVYLMKRRQQIDGTKSVASLMLASLMDLMLLIVLMVATGWMLRGRLEEQFSYVALFLIPIGLGVALSGLMITVCLAPNACSGLAYRCAKPLLRWEKPLVSWFVNKCLEVIHELTQIRLNRRFAKVWAYSLLSLGVRFGFQCYLLREMAVGIPILSLLFALAFTNLFNLLPIQSVGNFGTIEAPFAWALMRFGTSQQIAVASGFSLHLIILLYCLPLGIYGFVNKRSQESSS